MRDEQWTLWDGDHRDAWYDGEYATSVDTRGAWEDEETVTTIAPRPARSMPPAYPVADTNVGACTDAWRRERDWTSAEQGTDERWPTLRVTGSARWTPARLPALPGATAGARRVVAPRVQAFCEAPTGKRAALPSGVTLIPGSGQRPLLERRHTRGWTFSGAAGLVLAALLVLVVFRLSGPADSGPRNLAGLAADVAGAAPGAPASANGTSLPPLGLWQADVAAVPVLGGGGAGAPGVQAPGTASAPAQSNAPGTANAPAKAAPPPARVAPPPPPPAPTPIPAGAVAAAPFTPWPPQNEWMSVPGYRPYAMSDPAGDPMAAAFGQCTWWAQRTRLDENLRGLGNARYWAANARARGYRVGATPARGATVVFQPGVQGAGWAGHVAHVMILYPGGWFLISEMNAYGNGGGWGRVSYRYAHAGPGVAFIY